MATYSPTKTASVMLRKQTNFATAWTADQVRDGGLMVEAEAFVPTATREVFSRDAAVRGGYYELGAVEGSQAGQNSITLKMPMHGISATTPSDNPTPHAESVILSAILGGSVTDNFESGVVQDSSDQDSIVTSGGTFISGAGMLINSSGTSYDMGFIENNSSTTLELRQPRAGSTTADNSSALGTATSYLDTSAPDSFSIIVRSLDNNSRMLFTSCVPTSATITLDSKGLPTLEATFWVNEVSQSADGSALSSAAYTLPVLPPATGNNSARLCYGSASATGFDVESFSVSIEQELQMQLSHGADSGVRDVIATNRSVSCSFTSIAGAVTPWDSGNFATITGLNNTDDGTSAKHIQLTIGNAAGAMFGLSIPAPLNSAVPALSESNGLWSLVHEVVPGRYAGDTEAGAGTAANAPFALAFG